MRILVRVLLTLTPICDDFKLNIDTNFLASVDLVQNLFIYVILLLLLNFTLFKLEVYGIVYKLRKTRIGYNTLIHTRISYKIPIKFIFERESVIKFDQIHF